MADENTGGVVTTVKEETTKDLDVAARLAEANEGQEPVVEKKTPKPKAEVVAQSKDDDDDDEYIPLDFNSLDDKQKKAVARVYQDRRAARKDLQLTKGELADMRREIADLKRGAKPAEEPRREAAQAERPKPPNAADFTGKDAQERYDAKYLEYEDEVYEWRKAREQSVNAADAQAKKDKEAIDAFTSKAEAFAADHDDYRDVVDNDEPMTNTMFGACIEEGPELLYYLATHKSVAKKIHALGDGPQAVKEIMRVVTRLEIEKEAAAREEKPGGKTKKQEPPDIPPTPTGGRGAPLPAQKDPSKMTFKERERERFKKNPAAFSYEP